MLGGPILEITLQLVLVFALLSAVVSLVQELLAQVFQLRSHNLHSCIREMLSDRRYKDEIAKRFFQHPMLAMLDGRPRRPVWISPEVFAAALATAIQPARSSADPILTLPASIEELEEGELKQRLWLSLPQVRHGARRPDIEQGLVIWYDSAVSRMADRYRADTRARLFIVSTALTLLFNVSPIEIVQRSSADSALRESFASAVPELTTFVFNSGQGLPMASLPSEEPSRAVPSDTDEPSMIAEAFNSRLSGSDVASMLSLYHCSQGRLGLPMGWPWMAELTGGARPNSLSDGDGDSACYRALQSAGASPLLRQKLALIGGEERNNGGAQTLNAVLFDKQYGPSLERGTAMTMLLGWVISLVIGAQGAPFWFMLTQKLVRR